MPRSRRAVLSSSLRETPPEETRAEDFYFAKQWATGTEIVVELSDGEVVRGALAWYDRAALAVATGRSGAEIVIPKTSIVAVTKDEVSDPPAGPR